MRKIKPETQFLPSKQWWVEIGKTRFGYTSETIGLAECPYLHRKILWLGWFTLRYHMFYSSDEERALHDHPWRFWTFPLDLYCEEYYSTQGGIRIKNFRAVQPFRIHYRPRGFCHRVLVPEEPITFGLAKRPVRTFVATGRKRDSWGFWKDDAFFPWREWFGKFGMPPCKDD